MSKNTPLIDNSRFKTINLTIILAFVVVIGRLFYWQIIIGNSKSNFSQTSKLISILPNSGKILASDNFPLSLGVRNYKLSIYKPNLKIGLDELLNKIETINPGTTAVNTSQIRNLQNQNIKWVTLSNYFNQNQKQQLNIPGLEFEESVSRFYPEGNLAKNVITNLETFYRRSLNGKTGFSLSSIDGTGQVLLTKRNWRQSEIDGQDIKTSINRQVQQILEQTLIRGLSQYEAKSASGTIINPKNGQIIAMAYFSSDTTPNTNVPNVTDLFEPGSIFKPLIVAIGLDTKSINSDFVCTDCDRPRVFGQYTINNWDDTFHPNSTLKDIIKNSDNIGMSNIIQKIGLDNFKKYFHNLKLDSKNDIDLMGESVSPQKKYYSDIDLATASFGQGLAVNELQMIQAFNTLANQGQLVSSHFNSEASLTSNQVFSPETTNKISEILKYAVENGAVKSLKPKNLEVCAKSGTAQISIGGQYNDSNTIGSYIGFSPCSAPKFTMIITINQPQKGEWGSSTAAPLWYEIAEKLSTLL